jgi:hypothetical protein
MTDVHTSTILPPTQHQPATPDCYQLRTELIEAVTVASRCLKEIETAIETGAEIDDAILDAEIDGTDMDVAELLARVRCQIKGLIGY